MSDGVYLHPPGKLSRWGVIDVGLKCVHSCQFCYYAHVDGHADPFHGMRHAPFAPIEHLLDMARVLASQGFVGFDVTGGEPTIHKGIVDLAGEAKRLGLAMRVITLGQFLVGKNPSLLSRLIDAGVADLLLSVHAVSEDHFHRLTGGSWRQLRDAINVIDANGFDFCTNTTVHEGNFRQLPEIARELAEHRVYAANLIVMNAYYAWGRPGAAQSVQAHYSAVAPYVLEARDVLEAKGIAVNIRYAPQCTLKGAERNLVGITGVRHDPHEWTNQIDHLQPRPAALMGRRLELRDMDPGAPLVPVDRPGIVATRSGKVFPEKCAGCHAILTCDGIDPNYLERRGDGELEPYSEFRGNPLDRDRLAYLPAFVCKTAPNGRARDSVRNAFSAWGNNVAAAVAL